MKNIGFVDCQLALKKGAVIENYLIRDTRRLKSAEGEYLGSVRYDTFLRLKWETDITQILENSPWATEVWGFNR